MAGRPTCDGSRKWRFSRKPRLGAMLGAGRIRLPGIGVAALILAACGSTPPPPQAPPACPAALLLDGADRTTSYRPGEDRSPKALRYLAVLTHLKSTCRYQEQGVDVDLALDLIAQRGPAGGGDPVQLTYFIATIGPDRQILSKQMFNSEIVFAKGEDLAGVAEQLTLRLPPLKPEQAAAYGLYLGFQLSDAELQERLKPILH